jgi:hypothetical protein
MPEIQRLENGMHYIMVPTEIVDSFFVNGSKRAICEISDLKFHCAFIAKKRRWVFNKFGSKYL